MTPGAGSPLVLIAPTLGGAVFSTSGDVTINADRVVIDSASGITAGTGAQRHDPAGKLRLGGRPRVDHRHRREHPRARGRGARSHLHADAANRQHVNTGDITISGQITNTSTGVLSLRTGGAIADGTAGEQTDIAVPNLALRAATGIGTAAATGDLNIAASNLAFSNSTSGDVHVSNDAGVTISTLDGLSSSSNNGGERTSVRSRAADRQSLRYGDRQCQPKHR